MAACLPSSIIARRQRPRSPCSDHFSAAATTSTPAALKAARPASAAIRRPAATSGYGACEKPKIKCANCPHQAFLPVTNDAIRWHLSGCDDAGGDFVMGVYPMLRDETCFFLAADFDKEHWQEDIAAVREMPPLGLPHRGGRSLSGRGGHLWLFFAEPLPAVLARRLGAHILTETMERRPDIGLDSYDRLFPNQDTLPQGGFGNLIALPCKNRPATAATAFSSTTACRHIPINGSFLRRSARSIAGR